LSPKRIARRRACPILSSALRMNDAVKFARYQPLAEDSRKCADSIKKPLIFLTNPIALHQMVYDYFHSTYFAWPWMFCLGLLLPAMVVWYVRRSNEAALPVSTLQSFKGLHSWKTRLRHLPFLLRLLGMAFFIVALARPQSRSNQQQAEGEGVDIVLCIDVSGSMTAQDFTPNRMEAAKK